MPYPGLDATYIPSHRIGPTTAGWIVCRSRIRVTSGGLVGCPIGGVTAVDECMTCRFLEDVENDRDPAYGCATTASPSDESLAAIWVKAASTPHQLAVELL
jgi:hypothetical protein